MKKLVLLLAAVLVTAISANVFAQDQTTVINATHDYSVTDNSGTGHTYQWSVYDYDADYLDPGTTLSTSTGGTITNGTSPTATINWTAAGSYIVEVVETNGNTCTAIRRYHVVILDLDLEVVTYYHDNTTALTAASDDNCNIDEGIILPNTPEDINDASLQTMTMTYEVTLYTKDASDTYQEIESIFGSGNFLWRFDITNATTSPATSSDDEIVWKVDGTTITLGDAATYTVDEISASKVTITAEIQNIASVATDDDYVLNFSIDPTTVDLETNDTANPDYNEGEENTVKDRINSAYQITVHPIPNTSTISVD